MPRPFLKTRAKETRSTARPRQVQGQVDVPFMLLTVLLVVIGLIMLLSASYPSAYYDLKGNTGGDPFYYFKRQAVYALLGFGIMYLVSRLNYQGLRGLAVTILVVACLLMLAVKIPGLGIEVSGATRWLNTRCSGSPPSWAKWGCILYFASRLSRRDQRTPLSFRRNTAVGRFGNFLERIGFFELIPYFFVHPGDDRHPWRCSTTCPPPSRWWSSRRPFCLPAASPWAGSWPAGSPWARP